MPVVDDAARRGHARPRHRGRRLPAGRRRALPAAAHARVERGRPRPPARRASASGRQPVVPSPSPWVAAARRLGRRGRRRRGCSRARLGGPGSHRSRRRTRGSCRCPARSGRASRAGPPSRRSAARRAVGPAPGTSAAPESAASSASSAESAWPPSRRSRRRARSPSTRRASIGGLEPWPPLRPWSPSDVGVLEVLGPHAGDHATARRPRRAQRAQPGGQRDVAERRRQARAALELGREEVHRRRADEARPRRG